MSGLWRAVDEHNRMHFVPTGAPYGVVLCDTDTRNGDSILSELHPDAPTTALGVDAVWCMECRQRAERMTGAA